MESSFPSGLLAVFPALVLSTAILVQMEVAQARMHWNSLRKEGCIRDGHRRYWARLDDISGSWEKACPRMPHRIAGHHFARPTHCRNKGAAGMFGEWDVPDDSCSKCGTIARKYVNHFVHRVGYNENRNIDFRRNRNRVAENTWWLVRRDKGADLNRLGATPSSQLERCVKSRVIAAAASQRKLNEHIKYWGAGTHDLPGDRQGVYKALHGPHQVERERQPEDTPEPRLGG